VNLNDETLSDDLKAGAFGNKETQRKKPKYSKNDSARRSKQIA
jgi:hypothetical protein